MKAEITPGKALPARGAKAPGMADYLEQKQLLMTRILDLTRRMEAVSGEADFSDMEELLRRRAGYMVRCDKVDAAMERLLAAENDPAAQSRRRALLSPGPPPEGETAEERALRERAAECRTLRRRAAAINAEIVRTLAARRDALRGKLPPPSARRRQG